MKPPVLAAADEAAEAPKPKLPVLAAADEAAEAPKPKLPVLAAADEAAGAPKPKPPVLAAAGAPKPKPPVLAADAAEEAGKLNTPGLAGAALAAVLDAAPGQLKPPELPVVAAAELPKFKLKPPEDTPALGREMLWGPPCR